jgi:hypothetical protein
VAEQLAMVLLVDSVPYPIKVVAVVVQAKQEIQMAAQVVEMV